MTCKFIKGEKPCETRECRTRSSNSRPAAGSEQANRATLGPPSLSSCVCGWFLFFFFLPGFLFFGRASERGGSSCPRPHPEAFSTGTRSPSPICTGTRPPSPTTPEAGAAPAWCHVGLGFFKALDTLWAPFKETVAIAAWAHPAL